MRKRQAIARVACLYFFADAQKVARNYTENAEAYQLYLKGRYHYSRLTRPELDKAIEYYQQALALDQSYALAYTGLAAAYRSLTLTMFRRMKPCRSRKQRRYGRSKLTKRWPTLMRTWGS